MTCADHPDLTYIRVVFLCFCSLPWAGRAGLCTTYRPDHPYHKDHHNHSDYPDQTFRRVVLLFLGRTRLSLVETYQVLSARKPVSRLFVKHILLVHFVSRSTLAALLLVKALWHVAFYTCEQTFLRENKMNSRNRQVDKSPTWLHELDDLPTSHGLV